MEYKYNDIVSFLGRDVRPYWKVFAFNNRNQMFITPISDTYLLWDIDYKVLNPDRTPLFRVGKQKNSYNDLPLFKGEAW